MPSASEIAPFPVQHVSQVPPRREEDAWLIEGLWAQRAVGVIGGVPKCGKTWLGCELALSVATGTPAFGRFAVSDPGTVLFYGAEEDQASLATRFGAIAVSRGIRLEEAKLLLLDVAELRLDRRDDVERLRATVECYRPSLVVLDPFVRLARIDENSAAEVSGVLGELRRIQRELATAIVLAHHMRKSPSRHKGYQLRGSGDFAAWHDSALYLAPCGSGELILHVEHRGAPAPEPVRLRLVTGDSPHLVLVDTSPPSPPIHDKGDLHRAILEWLARSARPMSTVELRDLLRTRKKTLIDTLDQLRGQGRIDRKAGGWVLLP